MTENPRVNRYLKDKAFDRMDHALGRHFDPTGETFRNYFATDARGALAQSFDASPFWGHSGTQGDMAYYHVTEEGCVALKEHLKKHGEFKAYTVSYRGLNSSVVAKSASKAKYESWLRFSDCCPDVTFLDFVREAKFRRAA